MKNKMIKNENMKNKMIKKMNEKVNEKNDK